MPEAIRNDDDTRILEGFFLVLEVATELRSNFEDRQKVGRHADRGDAKRKTQTGDREVRSVESRDVLETVVTLLPVFKVRIRCRHLAELLARPRLADIDEALRVAERERPQNRAIEDRKDRCRCADTDGQRQNRHQRKTPLALNHAKGILKVAAKVGPDAQPPHFAHGFLTRRNASKIRKRPPSCFGLSYALFYVLSRFHFNVKPDFTFQIRFRPATLQQESELANELSEHESASTQYVVDGT